MLLINSKAIPLLRRHIEYLISRFSYFSSGDQIESETDGPFTVQWMQVELERITSQSVKHISDVGHLQNSFIHKLTRVIRVTLSGICARTGDLMFFKIRLEMNHSPSFLAFFVFSSKSVREILVDMLEESFLSRIKQPHSGQSDCMWLFTKIS